MSEQSRSAFDAGQCQKMFDLGSEHLIRLIRCPEEGVATVGGEWLCTECARYARRRLREQR